MSEIFCINGREFEVSNDYFRSLHSLRSECNSYIDAEMRYKEVLAERDKQIRNDAIDEIKKFVYRNIHFYNAAEQVAFYKFCEQMQKGAENE